VQGAAAPACVTTDLWPLIVMLPVRSLLPLGEALKLTLPRPLPDAGGASWIQPTSVDAVHPHSSDVVTVMLPPSAPALRLTFAGAIS
jgi:hypothetical protein